MNFQEGEQQTLAVGGIAGREDGREKWVWGGWWWWWIVRLFVVW